jgi:hypothetical protein
VPASTSAAFALIVSLGTFRVRVRVRFRVRVRELGHL